MTRQVRINHNEPVRYSDLAQEQKTRHNIVANYLIQYCSSHIGETVSWESIDNQIPHLYSFAINGYNSSHQNTQIVFDDNGVTCVRVTV